MNSAVSLNGQCWSRSGEQQLVRFFQIFLEREPLLSRNMRNPTVGRLRDKKEKCSMRRGFRVDPGFVEFPQTPRGRIFSLLEFLLPFKCLSNV